METDNKLSLEELRKQDVELIKKTRNLFKEAYFTITHDDPERFEGYTYEQFEKLYLGYIMSAINKNCDRLGIDIEEILKGM